MEGIVKKIKGLQFCLLSPEKIKKLGVAKIVTPELYDMDGYPVDGGLMDLRLGAIDPGVRCRTCGEKLKTCPGHFGYIELARPVIHPKYVNLIELFLRTTCNHCQKLLISEDKLKKMKNLKEIIKKARDSKVCPYCGRKQEKIKLEKPTTFKKGKTRLFPNEIREILSKIPDEICKLLGVNPKTSRPEWAIISLLLAPPVTIRPSITLESGERSEDDLTHKLGDIVRSNQRLWENLNAGAPEVIIEDLWDLLQYHITTFFDNNISQIPPARHRSGQPLKTLSERIKGKEGHIRHNLIGKRVNFSSRTVITPDPFIKINEVGIPLEIAKILTVPERVNKRNMDWLKELIKRGDKYPGANYIVRPDGKKKKITEEIKEDLINELENGYLVERHLKDGDVVLFNRHPSLHKLSLMSHFVKILPYRTFRMHPTTTFPYNADFDGDEMNVHAPQTEEAKAEAKILMNVGKQLTSVKNNANVLGCISDALTGNYLLTTKKEIPKADAIQLLYEAGIEEEVIEKIKFNKEVSGREIFSVLLPELDFETITKDGKKIIIKKGKLIRGHIDSNSIGTDKTNSLIKTLDEKVGRKKAVEVLRNMFTLGTIYLSKIGFTISISDIEVPEEIIRETERIKKETYKKVDGIIQDYCDNKLEIIPGYTKEESRERKITKSLNNISTKIGMIVKKNLQEENCANIMINSGANGNLLNITQMSCSVGQQNLWGKRIDFGYGERTLSSFKEKDLSPSARGFISSSFYKGLKPEEFFFTAITGRDSLMDTALRTPKSGYLYRRLSSALQDLRTEYDGTVREASGRIIQLKYGSDNVDVSKMHLKDKKINPGEAIGILTAQSFGEPATQMTLNVFHFAGVGEMQVTLGLPRLIEIFNATKNPSTPSMEIYLDNKYNNEKDAKRLAERIKEVKLKEIINSINTDYINRKISIEFDKNTLRILRLNPQKIKEKVGIKGVKLRIISNGISVIAEELSMKELYNTKEKLKEIIISGIKGISQVLLIKRDSNYVISTAGSNLEEILKLKEVNKNKTSTNNIHEVARILGIEAARGAIIKEILKTIKQQGLEINRRHIELVADAMTTTGVILGITRMGIISNKSSVLARASFETPLKHFVAASITGAEDNLISVIENIIFNQSVPVGTGLPGLLLEIKHGKSKKK